MIRQTASGVEVDVRVIPRASRSGLAGDRGGRILVRLSAPPVEGAANDALITFLAALFRCPRRAVRLVAGERSREKRVALDGVDLALAERLLSAGGQ